MVIDATGSLLAASSGANALTDPRDHLTADPGGAWIRVLRQSDRDSRQRREPTASEKPPRVVRHKSQHDVCLSPGRRRQRVHALETTRS
jgi:hypothetical protein